MRRLLTLFVICFGICIITHAQDGSEIKAAIKKQEFDDETIDRLKATTTVFFYSREQKNHLDSIKKAVNDGWKLTHVIFADISMFDEYEGDPKYSYFIIEAISETTTSTSGMGSYTNTHFFLSLRLFDKTSKHGKVSTTGLCRIELYPSTVTLFMAPGKKKSDDVIGKIYENGSFYNWNPVLIRAQLANAETDIRNKIKPYFYAEVHDDDLTNLLATDTLYVPETLLMSFNMFTGAEKEKNENIFENYPYKYKVCTNDELYEIFEKQQRGRFLFEYVKSSTDKFIIIYDLKQGKIIYRNYTPISYNIKSKDIEKITK